MPRYAIEFNRGAKKALARVGKKDQSRIALAIAALAEEPHPANAKTLAGEDGFFRIRVGDYRIVYEIDDGKLIVRVLRIGVRGEVYRKLVRLRRR